MRLGGTPAKRTLPNVELCKCCVYALPCTSDPCSSAAYPALEFLDPVLAFSPRAVEPLVEAVRRALDVGQHEAHIGLPLLAGCQRPTRLDHGPPPTVPSPRSVPVWTVLRLRPVRFPRGRRRQLGRRTCGPVPDHDLLVGLQHVPIGLVLLSHPCKIRQPGSTGGNTCRRSRWTDSTARFVASDRNPAGSAVLSCVGTPNGRASPGPGPRRSAVPGERPAILRRSMLPRHVVDCDVGRTHGCQSPCWSSPNGDCS